MQLATVLSIAAGCYAAWWVVNDYYYYYDVYKEIRVQYLFSAFGRTMSKEASTYAAYGIALVASLVTTFRGRNASLTPEQMEEKRARVLSSARSFLDTLVLLSYGEYLAGGRRIDIVFVILPLIGVITFLIGVWQFFVG